MLLEIFLMLINLSCSCLLQAVFMIRNSFKFWPYLSLFASLSSSVFFLSISIHTHKKELYWILRCKDRLTNKSDKRSSMCHLKRHSCFCKINTCIHMCSVQTKTWIQGIQHKHDRPSEIVKELHMAFIEQSDVQLAFQK